MKATLMSIRIETLGSVSTGIASFVFSIFLVATCLGGLQEGAVGGADSGSNGVQLGGDIETIWEFGVEVSAPGNAKGVRVTVPIPMDWPEQKVEVLDEVKTKPVGRLIQRAHGKTAKRFDFKINRMVAGQDDTAYIRFRITKKMIAAPQDTSIFSIAKKPATSLQTFLKPSPYIECKDKRIVEIADSLWDTSLSGWDQVEKNFKWVRENVVYEFDTKIRTCLEALDNKKGDCEELSSLFIAICRAQGIPARAVWIPAHTYPEFYLVDDKGKGHWFPCQAAGNYEFGAMTEAKPILQKGDRFKDPISRQEKRYLEPTLGAADATAPIGLKWIRREVTGQ